MESKGLSRNNRENKAKPKRKEIIEKRKAMDALIKVASAEKDYLSAFPAFRHYQISGLSAFLESGRGDKLSSPVKQFIQNLLKANMEGPYGSEWPAEEKVKRREMVAPEAHYVFLEPHVQGKGLGKFLMQLIELIACKNHMGAVVLTVQKANSAAMNFYLCKMRYVTSTISPSRVDPLIGIEKSYEILCKTFSNEAKAILEEPLELVHSV
ncbi:N-alpha-acetyltransferase 40-like isoform X2 [Prunus avium]|uniref:N-alpha-acetyltransferase 40 n=1 Tax=Prunus avium TaxID=42229 RepID=A0A6P5RC37_PRUAV|nr:N-alpha-acetyltransferase 40-like isoform X2 [Prunus avium]